MLMRNNCTNHWKVDSIKFSSSNIHKWRWFWQHRQFVVFRLKIFFNLSLLSMSYYFRNLILEWFLFKRFLWRFVFMKEFFYIKIFKNFFHILFYMEKIFLVHLWIFLETFPWAYWEGLTFSSDSWDYKIVPSALSWIKVYQILFS